MNKTKIIAGKFRNKSILLPKTDGTRPTKSIVRESLFNSLQNEPMDAAFVEVFAGSGSVGIEAISRGFEMAIFIERDKNAFDTLKANLKNLQIADHKSFFGDSFELFRDVIEYLIATDQKAWFYFDPPFDIRENMSEIYQKTEKLISSIPTDQCSGVAIEHISSYKPPSTIANFELVKTRKFGKTSLSYYK